MTIRFNADEVQKSIIFDRLINYLLNNDHFINNGLFANDAYISWRDYDNYQNYPYYFTFEEEMPNEVYNQRRNTYLPAKERIALINLSVAWALFITEKYNLENQLTPLNRVVFNKIARKMKTDYGALIPKGLLSSDFKAVYAGSIRANMGKKEKRELLDLGLEAKFPSGSTSLVPVDIDQPWLLQLLDFDNQQNNPDGKFAIATEYLGYLNNQDYNPTGSQGFTGLNNFHCYLLEFINEVEVIIKESTDILEDLNDNLGFAGFFDLTNFHFTNNIETYTMNTQPNLPNRANPAAAQAQYQSIIQSSTTDYFDVTLTKPITALTSEISEDCSLIVHKVREYITFNNYNELSFNINFHNFNKEFTADDIELLDDIEWLEHYIIIKNGEHWENLDFISINKPSKKNENGDIIDDLFNYEVEVLMNYDKNKANQIIKQLQNKNGIGLASAIYEDAIYLVLAINLETDE